MSGNSELLQGFSDHQPRASVLRSVDHGFRPRSRRRITAISALTAAAAALVLAGCAGKSDGGATPGGSTGSSGTTSSAAQTTPPQQTSAPSSSTGQDLAAAAKAAAEKAGPPVALPNAVVGNILFNGSSETTQRIATEIKQGASALNWKYIECDGQGNPQQWQTCADTLINRGATVLISAGIDPSALRAALQRAKSKGLLFFNTEALVPEKDASLYAGNYGPSEIPQADLLADYIVSKVKTLPSDRQSVAAIEAPSVYGLRIYADEVLKKVKAAGIKVVAEHSVNFADIVGDTKTITNAWLSKFPKLGAIFVGFDNMPTVAQVVSARTNHAKFPSRPLIAGNLDSLQNLQAIRNGTADAVNTGETGLSSLVALDQAAEMLARKTPAVAGNLYADSEQHYGVVLEKPVLVTSQQNLPSNENEHVPSGYDVLGFLKAKWATEFQK